MAKKATLIFLVLTVVLVSIIPAYADDFVNNGTVPDGSEQLPFNVTYRWLYHNVDLDTTYSSKLSPNEVSLNVSEISNYTEVHAGIIFKESPNQAPTYTLAPLTTYYMEFFATASAGYLNNFNVDLGTWKVIPADDIVNVFGNFVNDLVSVSNPAMFGTKLTDISRNYQVATANITSNTVRVRVAFQTMGNLGSNDFSAMLVFPQSSGNTIHRTELSGFHCWVDPNGDIFDVVVESALDNISGTVGNISNGIDSINDKLDNLFEEEKNMLENKAEQSTDELMTQMNMFNVDTTADACKVLYNAFTYDGTQSYFYLPATGNVPFIGRQLWEEQFIDITPDYLMEDERLEPLFSCVRFVLYLACAYRIVSVMIALVRLISGDGDAGSTEEVE